MTLDQSVRVETNQFPRRTGRGFMWDSNYCSVLARGFRQQSRRDKRWLQAARRCARGNGRGVAHCATVPNMLVCGDYALYGRANFDLRERGPAASW